MRNSAIRRRRRLPRRVWTCASCTLTFATQKTAQLAATAIQKQFGKLDLLINNAGIVTPDDGPPGAVNLDALNTLMQTNFIGTVAVTQAMLPLLRLAGRAQVINVSSELGSVSLHADPNWKYAPVKLLGYCASKAAMNMFTVQLAYELRDAGIAVNSINPGYTATDLNGHSGTQSVEQGAAEIVRVALIDQPGSAQFLETGNRLAW